MNSLSLFLLMFLPRNIKPTRATSNSKTLTDYIFSNNLGPDSVSRNLTATVSDHLSQFVIASNVIRHSSFSNSPLGSKSNIYEKDWTNFDQENFILEHLAEECNCIIKKEQAKVFFF